MISELELISFRNYSEVKAEFSNGINVIWGENGQGKTNLLEAVHVLAFTKSVRTNNERDFIKFGEEFTVIKSGALEMRFTHIGRRVMLNDGVKITKAKEWLGQLPVVFFGPQEINIVRGEPSLRRRFMDMAICQYKPGYTQALSVYNRSREQKSKILRDYYEKPSLLDALPDFNEKMAQSGEIIINERTAFIEALSERAGYYHSYISNDRESVILNYITKENLRDELERVKEKEIKTGLCLAGPHRDDVSALINGINTRSFASQGQVRTAALAFKMAERDILDDKLGVTPVMLLDDVLSELDGRRRDFILNHQSKGQTLITDCEQSRLKNLSIGKTLHVGDGRIEYE